jgi:hypothetical protein
MINGTHTAKLKRQLCRQTTGADNFVGEIESQSQLLLVPPTSGNCFKANQQTPTEGHRFRHHISLARQPKGAINCKGKNHSQRAGFLFDINNSSSFFAAPCAVVWECKRKGEKNFRKKLSKLKFRACSGSS